MSIAYRDGINKHQFKYVKKTFFGQTVEWLTECLVFHSVLFRGLVRILIKKRKVFPGQPNPITHILPN